MRQFFVNSEVQLPSPQSFSAIVAKRKLEVTIYFVSRYPGFGNPFAERADKMWLLYPSPLAHMQIGGNVFASALQVMHRAKSANYSADRRYQDFDFQS
jgi:hypothetical protein